MSSIIVIRSGNRVGQRILLGSNPLTLGRKTDNEVVIVGANTSRYHAQIVQEETSFVLYDSASHNGTYVNERRVTRHVLRPNDFIRIGYETFLYEAG
ncbi:FHA domain-containing protein [Streptomyces sp. NPDC048489]|uniref:FHA domain-containing protein n=1 Tax=Streptomyces sp. NPDC048489 TaxID=3154504 RepID=UPI003438B9D6